MLCTQIEGSFAHVSTAALLSFGITGATWEQGNARVTQCVAHKSTSNNREKRGAALRKAIMAMAIHKPDEYISDITRHSG